MNESLQATRSQWVVLFILLSLPQGAHMLDSRAQAPVSFDRSSTNMCTVILNVYRRNPSAGDEIHESFLLELCQSANATHVLCLKYSASLLARSLSPISNKEPLARCNAGVAIVMSESRTRSERSRERLKERTVTLRRISFVDNLA